MIYDQIVMHFMHNTHTRYTYLIYALDSLESLLGVYFFTTRLLTNIEIHTNLVYCLQYKSQNNLQSTGRRMYSNLT